jgi:23S rRNA (guanosine2251-2'-O)-methyltransferase
MGVWVMGASAESSQTLFQADLKGAVALVLGAEGHGLRRLTAELCDMLISIPMIGSVESLNVSVTAGIFLYEAMRNRIRK